MELEFALSNFHSYVQLVRMIQILLIIDITTFDYDIVDQLLTL